MSQTLNLFRLQQIDSQIDRAKNRLQAIQRSLDDNAELQGAIDKTEMAEKAYMAAAERLKEAEGELHNHQIKIQQTEASLYSSKAHSPKELQDLQNEVAALKRHRATLEDAQLETMIAFEEAETRRKEAQEDLQAVREHNAGLNEDLVQEQSGLLKDLEKLSTERGATSGGISPEEIRLYDQLRQQKRGLAIATISDNSCNACGSTLSLAQVQTARSASQIALCPSCGRILYGS